MCQKCITLPVPVEYHEEIREYQFSDLPEITDDGMEEISSHLARWCGPISTTPPPTDLTLDRVFGDLIANSNIRFWVENGYIQYPPAEPDYYTQAMGGNWTFDGLYGDTADKRRENIKARAKIVVRKAADLHAWQNPRFDTATLNWDAIGTDIKNKAGSIGKRVSKEVKRVSGSFLPDTLIESLNNLVDQYRSTDKNPRISFDQGFADGKARDYCNSGSCWWEGYSAGRKAFAENGGYAARLWQDDKPISRIFIIPHTVQGHDCHVIFNAYGDWRLNQWAETLAKIWGMESKEISLRNVSDRMYINGHDGYLLSPVSLSVSRVTLQCECGQACRNCGGTCNEEELHWSENGHGPYCCDCIPWSSCDRCGGECWEGSDDMVTVDGNTYCCESCANRSGYYLCYHCDEWYSEDDVGEDCSGYLCCDDCSTGETCHHCENRIAGGRYGDDYVTTQEGNCFCDNCQSEVSQCPHCDEWHETGEDTCPNCEDIPLPIEADVDASGIVCPTFISPDFICHTAEHPGIGFRDFCDGAPLQVRPVESAIDEWHKPNHGRIVNSPLAILAIDLCLSGF